MLGFLTHGNPSVGLHVLDQFVHRHLVQTGLSDMAQPSGALQPPMSLKMPQAAFCKSEPKTT